MEHAQLRYFLEAARLQHITRAAELLHVAQPALTQAIHRLEAELELPLFAPKGRNIVLTPYGEYFYKKLQPLMQSLDDLPRELRTMARLEDAAVHINVLAAPSLVAEAVAEYRGIDDSVRIEVHQNEQHDLFDIGVAARTFFQQPEQEMDGSFVCTEDICLAVPDIPRFQGKKTVALKDVRHENFVSQECSRQLRSICERYCASAGFSPNIIFEGDSPSAVKNMVSAGIGVGFWPRFSWGRMDTDRVLLLEIEDPPFSRDILITYKKNKQDNTKVEAFFGFLTGYFRNASCRSR